MTPASGVLVVGSLHYDLMMAAPHLPRLGETVTGTACTPKFGGKGGNQARAAAPTRMLSAVGADFQGDFLRAGLRAGGVGDTFVRTVPGVGSGMSVAIAEAKGDYGAVIVSGANRAISPDWLETDGLWNGTGVPVLQNEIPEGVNFAAANHARAIGARVCFNAAPFRASETAMLSAVDFLVVNSLEAEALGALAVGDLASARAAARHLTRLCPMVVVTAGGAGVAAAGRDGWSTALPAEEVAIGSTHGAGDAFTGAFAAALAFGLEPPETLAAANIAAARHVAGS